jgi:hypothetical protein
MYKFKVVIFYGAGIGNRQEFIETADSYGAVYNTHIAALPPAHSGYVIPLED